MNSNSKLFKYLLRVALGTGMLLLIPLIAMQFSSEVVWNLADFIIAGTLIFGTGAAYKLITRKSEKVTYRVAIGFALITSLSLIWVNGAIGIIGNEGQSANMLYGAVLVVGLIGSFLFRFKSAGMSLTLFAMAVTQMLVPVIALSIWPSPAISWSPSVFGVFIFSAFFALLYVVSALLFRHASHNTNQSPIKIGL